ncbi:unnamed protein product [Oikopleura dioica]|uniref:Uncharacterized protein n=1 Tax=Oikopleura dioica TaxID=34765 RepID=E4YE20_OIKDI|nr:unnamed protein product [Oikopleura dioica]
MKPYYVLKYLEHVVNAKRTRDKDLINLNELKLVLKDNIAYSAIEYIQQLFRLDFAEISCNHTEDTQEISHIKDILDQGDKNLFTNRNQERSLSTMQIEKLCESKAMIKFKIPQGGLKKRICFQCREFSNSPKELKNCEFCWRSYHRQCKWSCVCFNQSSKKPAIAKGVPQKLMEILGLVNELTMADKNFLTGVFLYSSTKFEFEEAPARKIRHEKCCGIEEKNEISAELIKAMYEERKQLNLQRIALQNSPRCAKCSKMATSQAGCCELHVYCELCRQDPEIYGISGVFSCPKEIIMKKTEVIKNREQLLMLLTRAWVVENEDDRILNRETKTDVKEIYDGARKNEVRTFHRDKLTVRRPPVVAKIKKRKEIDDDDFDFDRENDF